MENQNTPLIMTADKATAIYKKLEQLDTAVMDSIEYLLAILKAKKTTAKTLLDVQEWVFINRRRINYDIHSLLYDIEPYCDLTDADADADANNVF